MAHKKSPLGVHTSIAGGVIKAVDRALSLGCDAVQIFGRNPRQWKVRKISAGEAEGFRQRRLEAGLWPLVIHASYLMNLSTPDGTLFGRSVELLKKEIDTAEALGADYIVLHPGSSMGGGPGFGVKRVVEAFKELSGIRPRPRVGILLENTAGGGTETGGALTEIATILDKVKALTTGLCFDTCHGFAAGYPMKDAREATALVRTIDREVGLERLKLIHLNDSRAPLASRVDRHEHIGRGMIGRIGLASFLADPGIQGVPVILETPKKTAGDDRRNLKTAKDMIKVRKTLPIARNAKEDQR